LEIPLIKDVYNFLNTLQKITVGKSNMTLGELAKFSIEHNQIPDEDSPHEPFVLNFQIFHEDDLDTLVDFEEGDQFRVVITTRHLLKFLDKFKLVLQTDGTYKEVWQGFPIIIVGASDYDRHFHEVLLENCSQEAQ
jgi:hypothetical protein